MRKALILLVVTVFLAIPAIASASSWEDNFDDGAMNTSMWTYVTDGVSGAALSEANSVLNFTAPQNQGGDIYAAYVSKWSIDFSNDFGFSAQYQNLYDGAGRGVLCMDIGRGTAGNSFFAGGDIARSGSTTLAGIYIEGDGVTPYSASQVIANGGGWIGLMYKKNSDTLGIGFFSHEPNETTVPLFGQNIEHFTQTYNPGVLNIALGGYSENGAAINMGQVTMDNFRGSVAPEPVSSALFLVGGITLAAIQYRKRRKA